jgi:L-malate glycosyltransferase
MKIGIASPIMLAPLKPYLSNLDDKYSRLGLGAPAVTNLVVGMLESGMDVSVFTLEKTFKTPQVFEGPNLRVYMGGYRPVHRARMLDFFNYEAQQIKSFILQDKPDIVNAHWSYEFAQGTILSKVPHLITFRDAAWEILKFQKDLYRLVRYFIDWRVKRTGKNFNVNSPYLQEILASFKPNIPILPNPIREELIEDNPKKHPRKNIKIVSIATNFDARKNMKRAIEGFQMFRNKFVGNTELHLFGFDYGAGGLAEQWAMANTVAENVIFHGNLAHHELMNKLTEFDILLHPALEESFGNTLIEGMAKGLPVIGGQKCGAVPWVLNEGKNGMLVDVTQVNAIAEALLELSNSPDYYEKLSEEGIQYVTQNFASQKVAEKYYQHYQSILDKI